MFNRNNISPAATTKSISLLKRIALLCFGLLLMNGENISAQVINVTGGAVFTVPAGTVINADIITIDNAPSVIDNQGTINVTTLINNGTMQGNGAYNVTGTFTNTGTVTVGNSTFAFNGSGAQSIPVLNYNNLTIGNSGIKSAAGALTVSGDFTINGTASFDAGTSLTHSFLGNWIVNTSAATPFTFTTASTINFNTPGSPAATSISGSSSSTIGFNNVNVNNTSGFSTGIKFNATGALAIASNVTFTNNSTVAVTGNITGGNASSTIVNGSNATLSAGNALLTTGTLTATAVPNTIAYTSTTSAQTIKGTTYHHLIIDKTSQVATMGAAAVVNGDVTVTNGTLALGAFAFTENGTATINGTLSVTSATGVKSFVDLNLNSNATLTFSATATVAITGNLTMDNSSTITGSLTGIINVTNNLNVTGTGVTIGRSTITVTGTTTVTGDVDFNNATGTKTFVGLITISGSGSWSSSANSPFTVRGGITHDGASFTSGTGIYTFNTNAQSIAGSSQLTFSNLTVTGVTVSNDNTNVNGLTISTALAGTGGLTNPINALLNIGGTSAITTLTATASPNTVKYTSTTGAQTVKATTYHLLVIDKAGQTASVAGATTINSDLTVVNGTLAVGNSVFTVSGTTNVNGTMSITSATGAKSLADLNLNPSAIFTFSATATIGISGNLTMANASSITGTSTGVINVTNNLNLSGTGITIGRSTINVTGSTQVTGTVDFNNVTGTKTFIGPVVISSGASWASSGNTPFVFRGGLTHNGSSFTSGTGVYNFNTNPQTIDGSSQLTFANLSATGVTVTYSNTNAAGLTVTTALAGTGGLTMPVNGLLTLGGTSTITTLTVNANPNTVVYNSTTGAQTVKATTYHHLVIDKTSQNASITATSTVNGDITVTSGTLTISGGTFNAAGTTSVDGTLALGAATAINFNGAVNVNGTVNITSATGTKLFAQPLTLNAGSIWNNSANEAITFRNGLTHDGASFTSGTGIYTFDTNPQTIDGSSQLSINSVTITGVTVTYINTNIAGFTVGTALAGTGGLTMPINGLLTLGGTSAITTLTVNASPNTVVYSGAGAQTVKATTYSNLTLLTSGNKTTTGVTVNDTLLIQGTAAAITTSPTYGANAVLEYNGSGIQTTTNIEFPAVMGAEILINNSNGVTLNSAKTINDSLVIVNGSLADNGNQITGNATYGIRLAAGTTLTLGSAGTGTTFPPGYTSISLDPASTINYASGTTQTIAPLNYGNLTSSSTGNRILSSSGTIGIASAFTPGSNTFTITGSTIDFNGSSAQTIPAFNYNHLTSSSSGTRTLANSGTIGIAGTFTQGSNAYTIAGSTVNFNNTTGGQSVPAFNYNNLTVSNASGITTLANSGTIGIAGTFTPGSNTFTITGSTIDFNNAGGGQTVPAFNFNNLTVSNSSGTTTLANSGTIRIVGTYIPGSQAYTVTGSTVEFNGSSGQTFPAFTFNNLTMNNSVGLTVSGNETVNGTLTLNSGNITTGANKITIGSSGAVSRNSGHIVGNLEKIIPTGLQTPTFEIGDASYYTPVNLSFASVTAQGSITATTTTGDHPDIINSGISPATSVNRYWTLTNSGVTFTPSYDATFNFDNGDIDVGADPASFIVSENSGSWSQPTVGTVTSNSTQATGLSAFGDFQVGESSAGTYISTAAGGNWSSTSTWIGGVVPPAGAYVIIATTGTDSVLIDANTANIRYMQIASGAILSGNGSARLDIGDSLINNGSLNMYGSLLRLRRPVSKWEGTGSFNLSSINLNGKILDLAFTSPKTIEVDGSGSAIYGGTMTPGTNSTIDFDGILPQTINVSALNFNNVTIHNSYGVSIDAVVTGSNIMGDITVASGKLDNAGFGITLASGKNFSVENGGTFVLSGTSSMVSVSGGGTKTFGTSSTVEYDGTTQTVSSETYGNISFTNSVSATAGGILTAMGDVTIGSGTTFNASTFDHIVKGNWTNNGGTFTPNSQTITFNSTSSAQSVNGSSASQTFYNIVVDKSGTTLGVGGSTGTVTTNNLTITSGTFSIAPSTTANGTVILNGGTLSLGSNTFTAASSISVSGGALSSNADGTFVYGQSSGGQNVLALNYGGLQFSNFSKTLPAATIGIAGTFTPGSGTGHTITGNTIIFNGSSPQTSGAFTFNNLTLNNANGVSLTGPVTVNNTLTLTTGRISTGTDSVIIASSGTVTRTSGHVAGKLTKYINGSGTVTYEIGDATDDSTYTPAVVTYSSVSGPLALTASTQYGDHSDIISSGINSSKSVNRTWTLANTNEFIGTYSATLNFLYSDRDGGSDYNNYNAAKKLAGNWTSRTVGSRTANSIDVTAVDSLGDFQIGELETGTPLTWDNGGDGSSWNDANNWNPNQVPDSTNSVTISTATIVSINTAARANNVVINNSGATLKILATKSLAVEGNLQILSGVLETKEAFPTVGGTVDLSGGTVEYSGTGAQSISNQSYNNLTVSTDRGGGTVTFPAGSVPVSGTLTFSASTVSYNVTGNTIDFNGSGSQTIPAFNYNNLTSSSSGGRVLQSSGTIRIAGVFTEGTNSYTTTGSTVEFNGTSGQSLAAFTFNNLTMNNVSGLTLSGNAAVNGTLTLSSGNITTGANKITIGASGSVSRTSGYIVGNLEKTIPTGSPSPIFEIGDASYYTPVDLSFASVSGSGTLTAATTTGDHPDVSNSGVNGAQDANRYWTLTNGGVAFTTVDATFNFNAADVDGGADPTIFIVAQNNGSWSQPTVGTVTSTSTQTTGLTAFGDFLVGQSSAGIITSTTTGGLWSSTSTWIGGAVPAAGGNVVIATTGSDSVIINVNTATLASITINSGSKLSGVSGNILTVGNTVGTAFLNNGTINAHGAVVKLRRNSTWDGSGIFNLSSINMNSKTLTIGFSSPNTIELDGAGNPFSNAAALTAGTNSTFDFDGTSAQTIPVSTFTFNSIAVNNSAGAAPDAAITPTNITGDITIGSGIFNDGGFAIDGNSGKTFTVANGGTLELTGTNSFPTTFTPSLGATSTVNYQGSTQNILVADYGNLSLTNSGTKTLLAGTTGIAGALTVSGGASADATANATTIDFNGSASQTIPALTYDNLTSSNTGARTLASSGTISILGSFTTGSNSYTVTGSTVSFNGTSSQSSGTFTYNNLTLNNNNGLSLTGPVTVNNTLTLTTGRISTGSDSVIIASSGTISRTAGHVAGKLTKYINGSGSVTFEVGDAIDDSTYTPIDVAFSSVSGPLAITGSTENSDHIDIVNSGINSSKSVNRTWTLSNTNEFIGTYNVTLHFLFSDKDGGSDFNNYTISKKLANKWDSLGYTTRAATSISKNGIDSLGVFQAGEWDITLLTWDGGGDGSSWSDANNWNPDIVPTSTKSAYINSAATVLVTTAANANNVTIDNTGATLTIQAGQSLTLAGNLQITQGTLETKASFPAVTGSVDVSGGTVLYSGSISQTIAAHNYKNLTSSSTGARVLAGSGTIGIAGTFTEGTNSYTVTGSTIDFNGSGSQTIPLFTYNNLSISADHGGGTVTFPASSVPVSGALTFSATNVSYDVTGNTIDFNGSTSQTIPAFNYNNLTSSSTGARVLQSSGTIRIAGTFTKGSNSYTTSGSTVEFNGTSGQSLAAFTFNNLTMNNASGLTLSGNAAVNGTLTLTSGNITTGANKVSIGASGSVSRTSGYIIGNLEKTIPTGSPSPIFEIGDASYYTPVDLSFASVSVAGTLTATTTAGDHPDVSNSGVNGAQDANRYWTVTNSGVTFTNVNATFHFNAADVDGGADPLVFIVGQNNGSWSQPTIGTQTSTSTQAIGLTSFGDFVVGETSAGIITSTTTGGLWSSSSTWIGGSVPGNGSTVVIATTGGNAVTIDANTARVRVMQINSGSILLGDGGIHTLDLGNNGGVDLLNSGTMTMNGTSIYLRRNSEWDGTGAFNLSDITFNSTSLTISFSSPNVISLGGSGTPIGAGGTIVPGSNSTFNFNGAAAQTIPVATYNFNSIAANNAAGISPNAVITSSNVTGDITINGGVFNDGGFAIAGNGGKTFQVANGATLNVTGTNSFPTIFTASFGTTSTVDYQGSSQNIKAADYGHLKLTNAGTKTFLTGATRVAGDLTITGATADATTNLTTIQYNGSGSQSVAGMTYYGLSLSGSGTKTAAGSITVNDALTNTVTFDLSANSFTTSGSASISNAGSVIQTSGSVTFGAGHIIGGSFIYQGSTGSQSIGSAIYTDLTLQNGSSKIFPSGDVSVSGTYSVSGRSRDYISNSGEFSYNGTSAQAIAGGETYYNLHITGTADTSVHKSPTADFTVNGALTISANNNLDMLNHSILSLGGGSDNSGKVMWQSSNTYIPGTGMTEFYGSGAATVAAGAAYGNLQLTGLGTSTLGGTITVSGDLSVLKGTLDLSTYTADRSTSGGTLTLGASSTLRIGGTGTIPANYTTHVFDPTSIIDFYGTAQALSSGTYPNLTVSTPGGTMTLGGNISVIGDITVSNGTFDLSTFTANRSTLGGSLSVASGATLRIGGTNPLPTNYSVYSLDPTSTIEYYGTAHTIDAVQYGNLNVTSSGSLTLPSSGMIGIAGTFTKGSGSYTVTGSTINFNGTGAQTIPAFDYNNLALSTSGIKTFAAGTIHIAGDLTVSGATGDGAANSTTIEFNGSVAQAVGAMTYYNLTFTNNSIKTISGSVTANLNVLINTTADVRVTNTGVFTVHGDIDNSGILTNDGILDVVP